MKSSRWRVLRQLGVGVWLFVVGAQVELIGGDWPAWRGPEGNGGSRETQLPNDWSLLWKQPYGGRSTPVVHDGRVYVINRAETGVNEQERVMCFDAESGEVDDGGAERNAALVSKLLDEITQIVGGEEKLRRLLSAIGVAAS